MRIRPIASLTEVAPQEWNALELGGNPLVSHEFLLALEQSGCATEGAGWQGQHLLVSDASGALVGAMPLYLKPHSWGEFVFDWSWAGAYQRLGRDYYPKLVSAVPFTPATGARLLARGSAVEQLAIREKLIDVLLDLARENSLSSAHLLFVTESERELLAARGFILRCDCQFHWQNEAFTGFDDFMATFRADKRKKALRERRRVTEAGIQFETYRGCDLSAAQWGVAMRLSEATFRSHGHQHYLNTEFFRTLSKSLPEAVMVKFAMMQGEVIAAAIFFRGAETLYGRYWGAAENHHSLHFETCYYQGIDYCIEQGIRHFEPGTQGEHKIARGFAPVRTWSAHWIADPQIARAIRTHATQERAAIDRYIDAVNEHLPFHRVADGKEQR